MPRKPLPPEKRRARLNIMVYPSTLEALKAASASSKRSLGSLVDSLVHYTAAARAALGAPHAPRPARSGPRIVRELRGGSASR